jgi:hypothetical protein
LIVAGGFFAKSYLKTWTNIGKMHVLDSWKTLIVGTVFSVGYLVVVRLSEGLPKEIWTELFTSYIFATSFYELILGPVVTFIQKKISGATSTTPPEPQPEEPKQQP